MNVRCSYKTIEDFVAENKANVQSQSHSMHVHVIIYLQMHVCSNAMIESLPASYFLPLFIEPSTLLKFMFGLASAEKVVLRFVYLRGLWIDLCTHLI